MEQYPLALGPNQAVGNQDNLGISGTQEQFWLTQFNQHLLLTVQAINRLNEVITARMP